MKPILMSTPMVQATLEGRKKKTRRIMDPQPLKHNDVIKMPIEVDEYAKQLKKWQKKGYTQLGTNGPLSGFIYPKCPYGVVGDILWVRESWQLIAWDFEDGEMTIKYKTGETQKCPVHDPEEDSTWLIGQVDQLEAKGIIEYDPKDESRFIFTDKPQPWKPSIHMPKEACRLFLKIKSIKVERLQDISEEDAKAEGLACLSKDGGRTYKFGIPDSDGLPGNDDSGWHWYDWDVSPIKAFEKLWMKINGPESWNENPWVWVIEFERVEQPDNFLNY